MRHHFAICEMLIVCACLSPLALAASSFTQETVPVVIRRAEPPPANFTALQLELVGDRLRSEHAYLDAVDYYHASLAKSPNNAHVFNKLGIAELQMQHYPLARKYFEKAIKLDRKFA